MATRIMGQKTVFYPETDGKPIPDGEYQAPIYREIVGAVQNFFNDRPDVHVNGNTMMYYEEGNPRRVVSPDCYVAFGVDVEAIYSNNTYLIWEVGKPPDFVLEIGSASTRRNDLVTKRDLYARLGIGEYWRFDGTGGDFYREPLAGEYLAEGEYRRFGLHHEADGMVWGHSPTLNLDLCWVNGRLRFYDPSAQRWLLSYDEERQARQAAESALQAAEAARQAAETARQESEDREARLMAELRRLRGESQ